MTTVPQSPGLVKQVLALIAAQRSAFSQERVYWRAVALVLAEVLAFGSHRVTDLLKALGCVDEDWSAWYRLWQRPQRYVEARASAILFTETLAHVPAEVPYVIGIDCTSVPRTSGRLEGTGWLKCPRNPPWRVGIERAQRFLNGSWLTPLVRGYSRAIPLRFLPAFTEKAVHHGHPACKEHQAGSQFVAWVRAQLDAAGRDAQRLLCLADGSYDKPDFWRALPAHTHALVRTAKNRVLKQLPGPYSGRGRRPKYGQRAPAPQTYLEQRHGWHTARLEVRGRQRRVAYRVEGPFLRETLPETPLLLLVVRGQQWQRAGRTRRRLPTFLLVNALATPDGWMLPLPAVELLAWAWQRWELEVVHREVKTGLGLGDKQCFQPQSAVGSVQWSAWVYALLMLAGYRTYGLAVPPARVSAWHQPKRYTLTTVLDQCRLELLTQPEFTPLFDRSAQTWPKIERWIPVWLDTLSAPP